MAKITEVTIYLILSLMKSINWIIIIAIRIPFSYFGISVATHVWTKVPKPNRKSVMQYVFGDIFHCQLSYCSMLELNFSLSRFVVNTLLTAKIILFTFNRNQYTDTPQSHCIPYKLWSVLCSIGLFMVGHKIHICGDSAFFTLVRYFCI